MNSKKLAYLTTVCVAAIAAQTSNLLAQDTGGASRAPSLMDEVVVTAQKRSETLTKVPLSVQAFSGDALEAAQVRNADDLSRISTSLLVNETSSASAANFTIRGVGTTSNNQGLEQSVGVYVDGIFRSRPGSALQDFVDIERVEVLRGPQATIFGRNNPAGALSIVTKEPSYEFGGEASVSYGRFDALETTAMLTGPIVDDKAAFRVSAIYRENDGYIENLNGEDMGSSERAVVRGQLLFDFTEATSLRLIGDFSESTDRYGSAVPLFISDAEIPRFLATGATIPGLAGATPGILEDSYIASNPITGVKAPVTASVSGVFIDPENRDIAVDLGNEEELINWGFSGELEHNFDGFGTLTLLAGHRKLESDAIAELDQFDGTGPLAALTSLADREVEDTSVELRLNDETGGMFDWLAGLYYYNQEIVSLGQLPEVMGADRTDYEVDSYAAFGQLTYNATERLSFTAGLRYLDESKEADFAGTGPFGVPIDLDIPTTAVVEPNSRETDDDAVMGSVSARYEFDEIGSVYARYAQGYKSGGINFRAGTSDPSQITFDPETLDNYEIGGRFNFLDQQLRVNVTGFYQEVEDLQVNSIFFDGATVVSALINAAEAESKGVELEAVWTPTDELGFNLGVTYLDSTYTKFENAPVGFLVAPDPNDPTALAEFQDLSGETTPSSPEWSINGGVQYSKPIANSDLEIIFRGDFQYRTKYNTSLEAEDFLEIDDTFLLNIGVELASANGWSLSAWGQNLTDEVIITDSATTFGGPRVDVGPFTLSPSLGQSPAVNVNRPTTWGVKLAVEF